MKWRTQIFGNVTACVGWINKILSRAGPYLLRFFQAALPPGLSSGPRCLRFDASLTVHPLKGCKKFDLKAKARNWP